jgi:hypothetical protein
MNKSLKTLIIAIGALSIASSGYAAYTGAEFDQYFMGFFLGVTLIGSAFFMNKDEVEK